MIINITNEIEFTLPFSFLFDYVETKNSKAYSISSGAYEDEDGKTQYRDTVTVMYDLKTLTEDWLAEAVENDFTVQLEGARPAVFASQNLEPVTIGDTDQTITYVLITFSTETDSRKIISLLVSDFIIGDYGEDVIDSYCESLIKIVKTMKINEEPLNLTGITTDRLKKELKLLPH